MANILHVEDGVGIQGLVRGVLAGHNVTSVSDMDAALQHLASQPTDLVLTDYDLGQAGKTGLDLVAAMQAQGLSIPVIVASSHGAQDLQQDSRFSAMHGGSAGLIREVLVKPFPIAGLRAAVQNVLTTPFPAASPRTPPAGPATGAGQNPP